MNQVFIIYGDSQKFGHTVAPDANAAKAQALPACSRFTPSKDGASCDYDRIEVVPLQDEQRMERALALGFHSIEEMDEHQRWLDQNGTPEYKRWIAGIRRQSACLADMAA